MSDIVRLRPDTIPPSVEVSALVAYGDDAPRGLRQLAHELRLAARWLERRNHRRQMLRRRMEDLGLVDAAS